jgi:porphobilinogen deaminase
MDDATEEMMSAREMVNTSLFPINTSGDTVNDVEDVTHFVLRLNEYLSRREIDIEILPHKSDPTKKRLKAVFTVMIDY